MCRISGIWDFSNNKENYDLTTISKKMRDSMAYGGPDDKGLFIDMNKGLTLGHRRLSIIDLSPMGHQPMIWKNWVIVFNGEIYNYEIIGKELEKYNYKIETGSDTEIIIKSFDCWGYDSVQRFRGMFAFALWNTNKNTLLLCRDRVGVKPLYWYLHEDLLIFASELKAFHEHPNFKKQVNNSVIADFLQKGYINYPNTIFENTFKVAPGSFLEIDENQFVKQWKYWDANKIVKEKRLPEFDRDKHVITECEAILSESFNLRMIADVPVGLFLSGGIDSSLVAALLQKNNTKKLKTFTIGFEDKKLNEAVFAKQVSKLLGTEHTELYCSKNTFNDFIDYLPYFYDEPFGDVSSVPTHIVSKLAKQEVTVALSADGGDELFGGYSKYTFNMQYYSILNRTPNILKNIMSAILLNPTLTPLLNYFTSGLDWKLPKLLNILNTSNWEDFFESSSIQITKQELANLIEFKTNNIKDVNSLFIYKFDSNYKLSSMGLIDINSYLEGDILTKVDRATMQVALEGREPFLDHKNIEFALNLPDIYKLREGKSKWILRQILYKYIPKELIERPKQGFNFPVKEWLVSNQAKIKNILDDNIFLDAYHFNRLNLQSYFYRFFYSKDITINPNFIWNLYVLYLWHKKWIAND